MIDIRECSKSFGSTEAVKNVSMQIGEREVFRTCRQQRCRKEYTS